VLIGIRGDAIARMYVEVSVVDAEKDSRVVF
jgi:hypothetical protein